MKIGYNATDDYGSDGWWEEGETEESVYEQADENARLAGFPDAPELTVVDAGRLQELTDDAFDELENEWRLARRNGWTSDAADKVVKTEYERRQRKDNER